MPDTSHCTVQSFPTTPARTGRIVGVCVAAFALMALLPALCLASEKITALSDFDHGFGSWTTEGTAFGLTRVAGEPFGRRGAGEFFADSRFGGERATGVLRSPVFKCPDEIRFLANGWDLRDGTGGRNWYRLRLLDGTIIAQSRPPLCTGNFVEIRWQGWAHKGQDVRMEVVDNAADDSFAWLAIDRVLLVDIGPLVNAEASDLYAVGSTPGASIMEGAGVAFATWAGSPVYDNKEHAVPVGARVKDLYLLGCISTLDQGCPPWGAHTEFTRDFTQQQMIGDRAGELRIEYADGTKTVVPLVFGFTMWWDLPWRMNREPIASDPVAAAAFDASCRLKEVLTGDGASRYVLAVACRDKVVSRVVFVDSPAKAGCPAFWGLSVRTDAPAAGMVRLAHHAYDDAWLTAHRITPELLAEHGYEGPLKRLKSAIGMTDADMPARVARDIPKGFRGPDFRVTGGVFGDILTNAYYHTVHSAATKSIRKDGYIYCAPPDMPDYNAYNSIGTYQVISRGATSSWTRGYEYLRDLAAWGYSDEVTRAIDWADTCLDYYPKQCPLRMTWQGKTMPWPAHWTTMADHPEGTLSPGNNEIPGDENDGHALTMMMRYAQWRALGRDTAWLKPRWERAVTAAEWLCFVMDYTKQDVLYCESEGTCYGAGFDPKAQHPYDVYPHYEVFTNTLGAEALRQYAEMARALGDGEHARRWLSYAERIETAMLKRCTETHPVYGQVWRVHPNSIWPHFDERLAPVFELPYLKGFDKSRLSEDWLRVSRNSLKLQIGNPPDYQHGLGLGYGQGWVTPTAMLLDEMGTARPLLENLARYMYFPRHPYPFTGIEGIVVNEDGDFRVRNGTIGIDEGLFVTRVFRVMMGVDDTQAGVLSLMPRLPDGFPTISVAHHPFSIATGAGEVTGKVTYFMERAERAVSFRVKTDRAVPALRVRLGPFARKPQGWQLRVNGAMQDAAPFRSGDSWWVWADFGRDTRGGTCALSAPSWGSGAGVWPSSVPRG